MPSFYPNEGELLMQMVGLSGLPMKVGLFRNVVPQDGGVTFTSFTELTSGGGRAYATKTIDNALNMSALTASQWYVATNASGRAEAQYCAGTPPTAYMEWTFNSVDVADGYSVYGAYRWATVIPFDAGARVGDRQIMVGDSVIGLSSGAYAEVAAILIFSGSWAAGTAAGWLVVKGQSGTFQNDEDLVIKGEIQTLVAAPTAGGTGYALGDVFKITQTGAVEGIGVVTAAGAGIVSSVHLAHGGRGYSVAAGLATVKLTGAGNDDLTVEISAIDIATAYCVSNTGTLFAGDSHKKVIVVDLLTTAQAVSASKPVQLTVTDQMTTS